MGLSELDLLEVLPARFMEIAKKKIGLKDEENPNIDKLYQRYIPIFRGFENWDMRQFLVRENIRYFEQALQDLILCAQCRGECISSLSRYLEVPAYYTLSRSGMETYNGQRPVFIVRRCPGAMERKQEIRANLIFEEGGAERV